MLLDIEALTKEIKKINKNKLMETVDFNTAKSVKGTIFLKSKDYLYDISKFVGDADCMYKYGVDNFSINITDLHDALRNCILSFYEFLCNTGIIEDNKRYLSDKLCVCIEKFNEMKY